MQNFVGNDLRIGKKQLWAKTTGDLAMSKEMLKVNTKIMGESYQETNT